MRAFLALDISDEARDFLEDVQDRVKLTNRGKGTWSKPENLHLSLAFLDEITQDQAEVLLRLLQMQANQHGKFSLTLGHLGYFSDESSCTLWCSVNPSNDLKSLVSDVYGTVRDAGIRFDNKPFKAHITLGRKINIMNIKLSSIEVEPITIPVDGITLYKSVLRPDGPVYTQQGYVEFK